MQTMSEVQKGIDDLIKLLKVKYNLTVYKTTGTIFSLSYKNGVHIADLYYSDSEKYTWKCEFIGKKAIRESKNIASMKRILNSKDAVPSENTVFNQILNDIQNFEDIIKSIVGREYKSNIYKALYKFKADTIHGLIQAYFNKEITHRLNTEELFETLTEWDEADDVSNITNRYINIFSEDPVHVIGYDRERNLYHGIIKKVEITNEFNISLKYAFKKHLEKIESKEDLPAEVKIKLMMEEIANPERNRDEYRQYPVRADNWYSKDFDVVYKSVYSSNLPSNGGIGWVIIKP